VLSAVVYEELLGVTVVITSERSSSLRYTDVTEFGNGSFSFVVRNHVKVVPIGSQQLLLPVTEVLPV